MDGYYPRDGMAWRLHADPTALLGGMRALLMQALDPAAMAGLALLCYLAHGETPASPEFGKTVEKAMKYLVGVQNGSGSFGRDIFIFHGQETSG